jgi:hypothetical protein
MFQVCCMCSQYCIVVINITCAVAVTTVCAGDNGTHRVLPAVDLNVTVDSALSRVSSSSSEDYGF